MTRAGQRLGCAVWRQLRRRASEGPRQLGHKTISGGIRGLRDLIAMPGGTLQFCSATAVDPNSRRQQSISSQEHWRSRHRLTLSPIEPNVNGSGNNFASVVTTTSSPLPANTTCMS